MSSSEVSIVGLDTASIHLPPTVAAAQAPRSQQLTFNFQLSEVPSEAWAQTLRQTWAGEEQRMALRVFDGVISLQCSVEELQRYGSEILEFIRQTNAKVAERQAAQDAIAAAETVLMNDVSGILAKLNIRFGVPADQQSGEEPAH